MLLHTRIISGPVISVGDIARRLFASTYVWYFVMVPPWPPYNLEQSTFLQTAGLINLVDLIMHNWYD